ncbi:hypothetical protein D3C78_1326600 [compost metagenome]
MRFQLAQHVTEHVAWHYYQHIAAGSQRARQIGFEQQGIGESDIGKKCLIAAIALHLLNLLGVMAPQHHGVAVTRQRNS